MVFTSGATEAAALACAGRDLRGSSTEHDAVDAWLVGEGQDVVQLANSETGVIKELPENLWLCDATQAWGKIPVAFNWLGATCALASAHKLGGPKGIGALLVRRGTELASRLKGGGQEMGRRAGTENVIGIAGFGAAAAIAQRDLEAGLWERAEKLRTILEKGIAAASDQTIFVGNESRRLPNTSCFATPG